MANLICRHQQEGGSNPDVAHPTPALRCCCSAAGALHRKKLGRKALKMSLPHWGGLWEPLPELPVPACIAARGSRTWSSPVLGGFPALLGDAFMMNASLSNENGDFPTWQMPLLLQVSQRVNINCGMPLKRNKK